MDTQRQLDDLKKELSDIKNRILMHDHSGIDGQRISIEDLLDLISTVDTAPSHTPRDFSEQFRIYKNGTTYRFYWHDGTGWRYATGA